MFFVGCDTGFQPKGAYEEKVVGYCILSNKWDFTIARVYSTYNSTGIDPLENTTDVPVLGASVTVSSGDSVFTFRDTTIVRKDKSRYTTDIEAYVLKPFAVDVGQTYTMRIISQRFDVATAGISVPDSGDYIGTVTSNDLIGFVFHVSLQAKGYRLKFFIEFESAGQTFRKEVPQHITYYVDETTFGGVYPRIERRSNTVFRPLARVATDTAYFDVFAYSTMRANIFSSYSNPSFRQSVLVITQVEDNLYNYYNVANAFQDEYVIRLDEPDFTNIPRGHGVFGAFTEQTFNAPLPETNDPFGRSNF